MEDINNARKLMAKAFAGSDDAAILFVQGRQHPPPNERGETDRGRVIEELSAKYRTRVVWLVPHTPGEGHNTGRPTQREILWVRAEVAPYLPMIQGHVARGTCVFLGIRTAQLLEGTLPKAADVPFLSDPSLWRQGDKFMRAFDLLRSVLPGFVNEETFRAMVHLSAIQDKGIAEDAFDGDPSSSTSASSLAAAVPLVPPLIPGDNIDLALVERAVELGVDSATLAHQAALPEPVFCAALRAVDKNLLARLPGRGRGNRPERSKDVDLEFLGRCRAMGFCCADLAVLNPVPVAFTDVGRALGVRDASRDYRQPRAADPTGDDWLSTEDLQTILERCAPERLAVVLRPRRSNTTPEAWATFLEKVMRGEATAAQNPQRAHLRTSVRRRPPGADPAVAKRKRRRKGDSKDKKEDATTLAADSSLHAAEAAPRSEDAAHVSSSSM